MAALVKVRIFMSNMTVFKQMTALFESQQKKKNLWPCFFSQTVSPPSMSIVIALVMLLFSGLAASEFSNSALSSGVLAGVPFIFIMICCGDCGDVMSRFCLAYFGGVCSVVCVGGVVWHGCGYVLATGLVLVE